MVIDTNDLTPVEKVNGIYFKRDDLFKPFAHSNANGGKLRQCIRLIQLAMPREIVSYSSMNSPQLVIVSAAAKHFGLNLKYLVGGKRETAYLQLARSFGAEIIRIKPYRENFLFSQAKKLLSDNALLIKSGIINPEFLSHQVAVTANQVKNLPDCIDTIVVTCGSGLTAVGLLKGIFLHKKRVKAIFLISTAPNRKNFISNQLQKEGLARFKPTIKFFSLYESPGYNYNTKKAFGVGDVVFHPQYEAKTFSWFFENKRFSQNRTLFWIVGSEIC